jgi:L-alanine-DL-glutamate epimerase-like enolase superfamily enzyme
MKISRVSLYRTEIPLTKPYHTSIADISFFTTVLAVLSAEGKQGVGEGTPLFGYSFETPEKVWEIVRTQGYGLLGKQTGEAYASLGPWQEKAPFATTTLMSALEMLDPSLCPFPAGLEGEVPLVGILNVSREEEISECVSRLLDEGYETIKVKVGFDLEKDIRKVQQVQGLVGNRGLIRIDANQGYSFENALKFVRNMDPANIELFEQPFPEDQWEAMRTFAPQCPLPLMLDESIYGEEDIARAQEGRCARFIKLKLMKAGSFKRLLKMSRKTMDSGFKLILGNGIATDVGCYHEALSYLHLGLSTAGELNGFLKPKRSIFRSPLPFRKGKIILKISQSSEIDMEEIERLTLEKVTLQP